MDYERNFEPYIYLNDTEVTAKKLGESCVVHMLVGIVFGIGHFVGLYAGAKIIESKFSK